MIFNKIPDRHLDALRRKKYLSYLANYSTISYDTKSMPVKEQVEDEKRKEKKQIIKILVIATLKDQIAMLKQKLENEKNKSSKT